MDAPIGNWQSELEHFLQKTHIQKECHKLRVSSNDKDILKQIFNQNFVGGIPWIEAFFENCDRLHGKSADKTSKARQNGNKCFQKKQYKAATSYYTQAILNAPASSQDLALAYGNRSAALFHLSLFKACLTDIEEALDQGFPQQTRYKLLIRKLHCMQRLGEPKLLDKVLAVATETVEASYCDKQKKDQLLKEIKETAEKALTSSGVPPDVEEQTVPRVSHGNNDVLVQASGAVSLQCNTTQGRFLTASGEIAAGDTLIVEKPFAAVLLPDHYKSHCHHCFLKLAQSFPCRRCSLVKYCSPGCASDSWTSYHSVECPYLNLLHSVGIAHLSLRIVVIAGLAFLKDFRQHEASRQADSDQGQVPGLDGRGQYCRNYRTVYDLMTHAADMDPEDIFQYSMTAILLLRILQHSGWFCKTATELPDKACSPSNCQGEGGYGNNPHITDPCGESFDHIRDQYSNRKLKDCPKENDEETDMCNRMLNCDTCAKTVADSEQSTADGCPKTSCVNCRGTNTSVESQNIVSRYVLHSEIQCSVSQPTITAHKRVESDTGVDVEGDSEQSTADGCPNTSCVNYRENSIESSASVDVELYIGEVLLRHIQQLVCNAHAITELQVGQTGSSVEELSQVRVATAIYPTASLMNHSCDPTIIASFYKDILVVRAVKDVQKGGEIFNCYGPHHKRMEWSERQRCLREQYFFTCVCPPCVTGETEEALLYSYRCPACSGPLVPAQPGGYRCQQCSHTAPTADTGTGDRASDMFQRGLALLQQNRVQDALTSLKQCCKLRTTLLYKHNKHLSETHDCLARCFATSGQFKEAAAHLKVSLETVKVIYGRGSIEVGNELQKLSEILISAQDWRQALSITQEAVSVFTVHYGKGHEKVTELTSAAEQLRDIIGN